MGSSKARKKFSSSFCAKQSSYLRTRRSVGLFVETPRVVVFGLPVVREIDLEPDTRISVPTLRLCLAPCHSCGAKPCRERKHHGGSPPCGNHGRGWATASPSRSSRPCTLPRRPRSPDPICTPEVMRRSPLSIRSSHPSWWVSSTRRATLPRFVSVHSVSSSTALAFQNSRCGVGFIEGLDRSTRRRSVLRAFLVLGSDRPFVSTISAAPSKSEGLPVDRRLRPYESSDAAFGAPVRKPKAQIHERGAQKRTSRPNGPDQPWTCSASVNCSHRSVRCAVEVKRSECESPSGEMRVSR